MKSKPPTLTYPDIQWLESEFLPKLAHKVKEELSDKLDDISAKLDTFVGEIRKRRDEDTVHSGDHSRINDRLLKIEDQLHIRSV